VTYSYTVVEWTLSVKAKWQAMPGDDEQSIAFDTLTVALRFQSIRRYLSLTQSDELACYADIGTERMQYTIPMHCI